VADLRCWLMGRHSNRCKMQQQVLVMPGQAEPESSWQTNGAPWLHHMITLMMLAPAATEGPFINRRTRRQRSKAIVTFFSVSCVHPSGLGPSLSGSFCVRPC
jgi:hypothetical protein